ncbi:hypothetical protein AB0M72_01900, partial [Nocardiopsis dassonvillei]
MEPPPRWISLPLPLAAHPPAQTCCGEAWATLGRGEGRVRAPPRSILKDYVGGQFTSIHQYLVIKGDNLEALR